MEMKLTSYQRKKVVDAWKKNKNVNLVIENVDYTNLQGYPSQINKREEQKLKNQIKSNSSYTLKLSSNQLSRFILTPQSLSDTFEHVEKLKLKNFRGIFINSCPDTYSKNECGLLFLLPHAVCYRIRGDTVFYFDSSGDKPYPFIFKAFKNKKFVYNKIKIQPDNTTMCVHLCLVFLKLMETCEFDEVIKNLKNNKINLIKSLLF